MKHIYESAKTLLTPEELDSWIFFAYGVMESGIENMVTEKVLSIAEQKRSIETVLLKGISQEIEYRNLIKEGGKPNGHIK